MPSMKKFEIAEVRRTIMDKKMFFQNFEKPNISDENEKQLQKVNFKMNPTVRCGEKGAKNGLEVRLDQKDDCAVKTSTCHDLSIPGGLVSSTRHDNLDVPGVAGG